MTSFGNCVYWLRRPITDDQVSVLRRVLVGCQRFDSDRFDVAYLIARDCVVVEPTEEGPALKITAKGKDAYEFYTTEAIRDPV